MKILDPDSYNSIVRSCRNALRYMLGWSELDIEKWVAEEINTRADSAVLYNDPPAAALVRAFVPMSLASSVPDKTLQPLVLRIYEILESRGHWNDFSDIDECKVLSLEIEKTVLKFANKK